MDNTKEHFETHKDKIARQVATELSSEFGSNIIIETEKLLDPNRRDKRAFQFGLSEAAAAASLIIGCIQLVLQYYSDKKLDNLISKLEDEAPKPEKISAEKRSSIIRRIVEKFNGKAEN